MRRIFSVFIILNTLFFNAAFADNEEKHEVNFAKNKDGFWRIFINGKETAIRGAGGVFSPGMLEQFSSMGGNFTRTWGIESLETKVADGKSYIDRAHELGVNVMAGIWIGHERHGFKYSNREQLLKQREEVRQAVRKWKHHPGIAIWGLGNEMEGPQNLKGNPAMWKELEVLAKIIQVEDPNRPVMTVIAGSSKHKIQSLIKYCPSIDAVGVNSYGAASAAGEALVKAGWKKPFAITEFGVKGFWEAAKTPWGAPIEQNSTEKAKSYYAVHKLVTQINKGKNLCLGTFAFLWGWKQEKTSTWFGMCLKTGEKLAQVDALVKAWTGAWPKNRCPKIIEVKADFFAKSVKAGSKLKASVKAEDPEGDTLQYDWLIVEESKAHSVGGDKEYEPPSFPSLTVVNYEAEGVVTSPQKPGQYRLFLTIRDGKGNASTANIPFLVK